MIRVSCLAAVFASAVASPVFARLADPSVITPPAAPVWNAFTIRNAANANTPIAATGTSDGSLFTAQIDEGGEKAGYGTHFFDNQPVGSLTGLSYSRLDTGSASVYLNLWVTDGTHYANIAPVVGMNGTGNYTGGVDVRDQNLQNLGFNVYDTDTSNLSWMYSGATRLNQALIGSDGHVVTLSDISNLTLADPGTYSSFVGSGAAKNGTAFNLIVGDTQGNFTSPVPYLVSNVAVPEPTIGLLAVVGLVALRRRRAAR